MRDLLSNLLPVNCGIDPQAARTATVTGSSVDRYQSGKMFQAAMVVVQTGTITDGTHAFTIEESDDNSAWGTAPAASIQGTAPTLTSTGFNNKALCFSYIGMKRYVRVKSTVAGTTSGGFYAATIVLGDPRVLPAQ